MAYVNGRQLTRRSLRQLTVERWCDEGRRPVMPLMGYPGLGLTRTTIKQNQFNHQAHYQTVSRLYERFHPHAMLMLMDLSVEASALGLPVRFPLDETPTVEAHPVHGREDLDKFRHIDILADGRVLVFLEVMRHMRAGLPVPVGAYVIGPFTLAGLLMGASGIAMNVLLEPELCREVLEFSFDVIMSYARALVDAGADTLMVLDPTAVMLGPQTYSSFAGLYVREMIGLLHDVEIILHVCGNTMHLLKAMVATGAAGLSLDTPLDMVKAASIVGPNTLLIGNIDPVMMLREKPERVHADTTRFLDAMAEHPLLVLSTGCDLPQDVPFENIQAFMDAGRQWRAAGGA